MSQGPLALVLEPEGYKYAKEEGAYMYFDADDFVKNQSFLADDGFWKPSTSGGWILSKPLQLREDWFKDPRMADHTLNDDDVAGQHDWLFDTGASIIQRRYLDDSKLVAGAHEFPWNKWFVIATKTAAGNLDILENLYNDTGGKRSLSAAMLDDGKFELPTDIHVRAASKEIIPEGKSPVFRISIPAPKDNVVIVGFGQFAILFDDKNRFVVLETLDHGENWIVNTWNSKQGEFAVERKFLEGTTRSYSGGGFGFNPGGMGIDRTITMNEFLIVACGSEDICIVGKSGMFFFKSKRSTIAFVEGTGVLVGTGPRQPIRAGRLWIAARDNVQIFVQVEKVAYETAEHIHVDDPWPPLAGMPPVHKQLLASRRAKDLMFDFGDEYKPSVDPETAFLVMLHTSGISTVRNTATGKIHYTGDNAEEALFDIYNQKGSDPNSSEDYELWESNEENKAGRFHIRLVPTADGEMCPQFKSASVIFDAVLEDRYRQYAEGDELIIKGIEESSFFDSKLARLASSSSYDELLDKKFEAIVYEVVSITDTNGVITYNTPTRGIHQYERREEFPAEVREDSNLDNDYETVRIRVWIKKIARGDLKWIDYNRDGIPEMCVREYHVVGVGLGARMDRPWMFINSVQTASNNGKLSHTEYIRKCVKSSGIDPDQPVQFLARDDTTDPPETKYIPSNPADDSATMGQRVKKNPFQPEFQDTKADASQTVADAWSGYRLSERQSGQITYFPDALTEMFFGQEHPILATIYPGLEMVTTSKPWNYYLETPNPTYEAMPVQANAIRLIAEELNTNEAFQIVLRSIDSVDPAAVGPPLTELPENFVGEWKCAIFSPQWPLEKAAAFKIAGEFLIRLILRSDALKISVPTAPWNMIELSENSIVAAHPHGTWFDGCIDVGDSLRVWNYGKHVVFHSEFVYESQHEQTTNFALRKWPKPSPRIGAG